MSGVIVVVSVLIAATETELKRFPASGVTVCAVVVGVTDFDCFFRVPVTFAPSAYAIYPSRISAAVAVPSDVSVSGEIGVTVTFERVYPVSGVTSTGSIVDRLMAFSCSGFASVTLTVTELKYLPRVGVKVPLPVIVLVSVGVGCTVTLVRPILPVEGVTSTSLVPAVTSEAGSSGVAATVKLSKYFPSDGVTV